jgi:PGF-CTERM protein
MNGLSTRFDRIDPTTTRALVLAALVLLSSVPATAAAGAGAERAALAVTIDATNSPVNESETLEVTATVQNNGRKTVRDTVALTVGGEQRDAAEVELGGGENTTVTLAWATGDGDAGTYSASVATANDTAERDVEVVRAGGTTVTIDSTNSPVTEGDTMKVKATVQNNGRKTVRDTVALTVGGAQRDAAEVELGGGENRTVTLTWQTSEGDGGTHDATVATANDSDTTDVSVREPAEFSISVASTTSPVTEGEDLDVTVVVSNVGDLPGNQTVTLSVGAARVDSTDVGLDAGERAEVTLTWATGEGDAGNYSALVTSENDSVRPDVRVNAPSEFSVAGVETNSAIVEGETLLVNATVTNTGDESVTETVALTVGGEQRDATRVTLGGSENTTVTLTWQTSEGDAGTYTADLSTASDTAKRDVEVREETANEPPTVGAIEFIPCDPDCDGDPVAVAGGHSEFEDLKMTRGAKQNATMLVPNSSDSDGEVASYAWRVDGEVVSESRTLEYTFEEAREYELALTVTDDDGASTTARVALTVEGENEPPSVSIGEVRNNTVRDEATIPADAQDPDGNITTYVWTVDGEVVSRDPTMAYTFEEPGEHEVALRVTDDDGATTTETVTVTVESANEPPDASVQADPSSPTVGDPVTISVEASDPDGSVASYRLDVDGDGEYENRSGEATHTFQEPGAHEVTLLVTDDDGRTTTVNRTIQVSAAGTPTPSEDPTGVGSPGFGPLAALVALGGAALLARRRV